MDLSTLDRLQDLLKLPGTENSILVEDTCVLSCGCLASEQQFETSRICPDCHNPEVHILKPVLPLRQLYHIVSDLMSVPKKGVDHGSAAKMGNFPLNTLETCSKTSSNDLSKVASKNSTPPPDLDLLGLFCKFAREEQTEKAGPKEQILRPSPTLDQPSKAYLELKPISPASPKGQSSPSQFLCTAKTTIRDPSETQEGKLFFGLEVNAERNFSECFPFHRKVSSFATQQGKLLFSSRTLIKKINRFSNSAITTYFDHDIKCEVTHFVLISDKKWELYRYTDTKPMLIACGRLTSEYGPGYNALKYPKNTGVIIHNDFADKKPESDKKANKSESLHRLKSWDQLHCCLSERYLVILGTKGIMRVLNVDPTRGEIGQPVYTYIIDFPIRCIALAHNNELLACGITTKEKMSGKQQPFIILHHIKNSRETDGAEFGPVRVNPITITVPYRDPLKILNFNSSSTNLLCCTVYEMRYFIISLRGDQSVDYKRPRLIFSDTRSARRGRRSTGGDESVDGIDHLLETEDDDQVLDNEGITDIKFGQPFTNTIVITSSSLKNKPSVVLKINGPALDSRKLLLKLSLEESYQDTGLTHEYITSDDEDLSHVTDVDVLLKVHEIGSNIYRVEVSPRGDSILFVDKLGRLLLVATKTGYGNIENQKQMGTTIVLLGEVSPALRYTESASVCFSSDGGKVMTVDRKGIFQVFDFTKGIPGEDPEVIKCKIISLR
ncbi:hypothetical protein METBIDRAFT_29444 [Metschnikowia bicuspidata var. bicuspidata NRRL YB-4993]|uniref:Uncharacterized protein n=1 Tax=Metschnikowia bicuspidata var. bicuspidata NRRL YB-4993 TaxID=869754 RepID=A0A1A0HFV5_9ASCO|nr:hypothetical protein METBIDRAFT_29444 [Metschnikowia bicuspidata var. bicuspidata NRRL YB-4993]OBA22865.1 hypothetical protein METBIDRAFT_29444 [Metschnikowia bicuspidata var. bicuspidata NRRL YB-4993]